MGLLTNRLIWVGRLFGGVGRGDSELPERGVPKRHKHRVRHFLWLTILMGTCALVSAADLELISAKESDLPGGFKEITKIYLIPGQPFRIEDNCQSKNGSEFHQVAVFRTDGSTTRSSYSDYYVNRAEGFAKVRGYAKFDKSKGAGTFALFPLLEDKTIKIVKAEMEHSNYAELADALGAKLNDGARLDQAIPQHTHFGRSLTAKGFVLVPDKVDASIPGSVYVEFMRQRGALTRCWDVTKVLGQLVLGR